MSTRRNRRRSEKIEYRKTSNDFTSSISGRIKKLIRWATMVLALLIAALTVAEKVNGLIGQSRKSNVEINISISQQQHINHYSLSR